MSGIERIAVERRRQVEAEGFDAEHDTNNADGQLSAAASCYARIASYEIARGFQHEADLELPEEWRWGEKWWKPKDALRNLERAGALIAAEIDRLLHAEANDELMAQRSHHETD